jgi:hypothetical protein
MDYNETFQESKFYPISTLSEFDLNFLKSKELITQSNQVFQSNFVGEIITPENSFFSVPKNFDEKDKNIVKLFLKILNTFSELKKEGKTLLINDEFTPSVSGEMKSEKFYYLKIKEYFLDFITYEFIYPQKSIKKHSTSPLKGKIDIFSTIKNRKQKGPGITYNTKDVKNSKKWNIDDIYWSLVKYLTDKWGTSSDKERVYRMKQYLKEEGYEISEIDISNSEKVIEDIKKCDVGIIHYPIKKILIQYFESVPISKKIKIRAFYTKNFQYVWEEIIRISLYHSDKFKDEISDNFETIETQSKWIPNRLIDDFLNKNPKAIISKDNKNIVEWEEIKKMSPDVFSETERNGIYLRFIGDAKYYNEIDSSYSKEMKDYNIAMNNEYPMCIFVPSDITTVFKRRRSVDGKEIIIFKLDTNDVISDAISIKGGSKIYSTIDKVHRLINKYTNRKTDKNGFNNYS